MKQISPRTHRIVAALQQGQTPSEIANRERVTTPYVKRLAKLNGIQLPSTRRGPKLLSELLPASALSAEIGRRFRHWRCVVNDLPLVEAAELVRMGLARLANAEDGLYELTVAEVNSLAETMGIPALELFGARPAQVRAVRAA